MKRRDTSDDYGILTDVTKCTGCEQCVAACKRYNGQREGRAMPDEPRRWTTAIDDLSPTRYTTIVRRPGGHNVRKQCRHCLEPACVSACIVGALQKADSGAVFDDFSKCIGCRYCMVSCPFGVPRYDYAARAPMMRKCNLCYERIADGKGQPACTEACPEGATIFGKRADLIEIARGRLKAEPAKYVQRIFGETEVGGTSVLYIAGIPLGFLAWDPGSTDPRPLPERTWASLSKVPGVILGMGGAMAAAWWVIGRRMRNQAAAAMETAAGSSATPDAGEAAPDEAQSTGSAE